MLLLVNLFHRYILRSTVLTISIFITFSCNEPEIDIPEYESHDWYAHYLVDGNEQTIIKDGTDNNIEPWLNSSQSYGFNELPNGSEEVTFVSMQSGITTISEESNSQMWFTAKIVTEDPVLIAMKGMSKEVRLNKLISYLDGRKFLNTPSSRIDSEHVSISLQDKLGNLYLNKLYSNGTYGVILDYEIEVEEVGIVTHEEHGDVVQVAMNFRAEVQDVNRNIEFTVEARIRTYLIAPFE